MMIPDAECVRVMAEILTELNLGKFVIKVCFCFIDDTDTTNVYPCCVWS